MLWRQLLREWRSGEIQLLAVSLLLAVAIVSGVSGFTDRLHRGIVAESHRFLAADRVLQSPRPVPAEWIEQARDMGLETAATADFQSMLFAGEGLQLSSVKAVTDAYPLKGEIKVASEAFGEQRVSAAVPSPGALWLAPRLLPLLDIAVGDEVELGIKQFRVEQLIVDEPDRATAALGISPRVMMNWADLEASGVVQPGSRVRYRYLFAGEATVLEDFESWLAPKLMESHRWIGLQESQPGLTETMARAERFLLLAASFGVALAGLAVALASRRYASRHFDPVAVMKSLGASSATIRRQYLGNLLLLGVIVTPIGGLLGSLIQWLLFSTLSDLMGFAPPAGTWRPWLAGSITALVCLLAFALPPIWQLQRISPLRVLRRDQLDSGVSASFSVLAGLLGLGLLMWWYSRSLVLASIVLLAMVLLLLLAVFVLYPALGAIRAGGMQATGSWRLSLAALNRRRAENSVQVAGFALALMVSLSLLVLRGSLLEEWQLQLDDSTPNHFLVNIAPEDVDGLQEFWSQRGHNTAGVFPMVRARLTHVDGRTIDELEAVRSGDRDIDREHNLSWASQLPEDNELIAGEWADAATASPHPVSVEKDIAQRMGLELGSRLRFDIANDIVEAQVSSIRSLDWTSMRPNFYFLFRPGALDDLPATFITSLYLAKSEKTLLNDFVRQFPSVVVLEIDAVIEQARSIVQRVSMAIEGVLVLIIICSLLVTVASVRASLDERLMENAVLRSLGASRRLIRRSLWIEFALLGGLAGLLAAAGAEAAVAALQVWAMDMTPGFHPGIWIGGPLVGAVTITIIGDRACHRVVDSSPLSVLRNL